MMTDDVLQALTSSPVSVCTYLHACAYEHDTSRHEVKYSAKQMFNYKLFIHRLSARVV